MDKDLENKYIQSMDSTAPDMDKLWERISSESLTSDSTDISAFTEAYKQIRQPEKNPLISRTVSFAAAAAAVVITIGIVNNTGSTTNMQQSDSMSNTYNGTQDHFGNEVPAEEMLADSSEESLEDIVVGSSGWDFRTDITSPPSYMKLDLAETESGIYTALSSNNEEEYFVENRVLSETDFFLDARIISAEIQTENNTALYEAEVIHLIGDGITTAKQVTVRTSSPYELRVNREYLLPIKIDNGEFVIVFDNAPQIEFTLDREVVAHNGWESLNDGSEMLSDYVQTYRDDYFYDRMNLIPEVSLEKLFDRWEYIQNNE
ncbi:MAG: hypothetical protein ACI4KF_05445 [Huintestinicola sp.]